MNDPAVEPGRDASAGGCPPTGFLLGSAHGAIGVAIGILLLAQLCTGAALLAFYCPASDLAHPSVDHIQRQVPQGQLVRSLHAWATSALIALTAVYLALAFKAGSFAGCGRRAWVTGVAIGSLFLTAAFTGSVLPWDGRAGAALSIAVESARALPGWGDELVRLMLGAERPGTLTLGRFTMVHVGVLPVVLFAAASLHGFLAGRRGAPCGDGLALLARGLWMSLGLLLVLVAVSMRFPVGLEAPAGVADAAARPDWYFLPLYQLSHYLPGRAGVLAVALLPAAFLGLAMLWPWIERSPAGGRPRRLARATFGAAAASYFLLMALALAGRPAGSPAPERVIDATAAPGPSPRASAAAGASVTGRRAGGEALFASLRCAACHDGKTGPRLDHQGSMVQPAWLSAYLAKPYRIRWQREDVRPVARMPDYALDAQELADLTAHLSSWRDDKRFPDRDRAPVTPEALAEGRRAFQEYQCQGCHVAGGAGTNVGPELTRVGARLRRGFLEVFLKDPAAIVPGSAMKDLKLWPEEAEALAAYLSTMR